MKCISDLDDTSFFRFDTETLAADILISILRLRLIPQSLMILRPVLILRLALNRTMELVLRPIYRY